MNTQLASHDVTVEAVYDLLDRPFGRRPAALPLTVCVEELDGWFRFGRDEALAKYPSNGLSLLEELRATLAAVTPSVDRALGPALVAFDSACTQFLKSNPPCGLLRNAAIGAAEQLRDALARPESRQAAWDDLVLAATSASISLDVARSRVAQLKALTTAAGWDWKALRRRLTGILINEGKTVASAEVSLGRRAVPARWSEVDPDAKLTAEERLVLCREAILPAPARQRCIVWFGFRRAQLLQPEFSLGPLTLLTLEDVRQRMRSSGETIYPELEDRMPEPPDEGIVLVRVELADHLPARARDTAHTLTFALTGHLALAATGNSWVPIGWEVVSSETGGSARYFATEEQVAEFDRTFDRARTANRLNDDGQRLVKALTSRTPYDGPLAEALHARAATKGADDRVRVLLDDRAMQAAATSLEVRVKDLEAALKDHHAYDDLRTGIMAAANTVLKRGSILRSRSPDVEAIAEDVYDEDRPALSYQLSFVKLAEKGPAMRAVADGLLEQRTVDMVLRELTDSAAWQKRIAERETQTQLLADRRRRVRNCIAHANPVEPNVLSSTVSFSSYLADGAAQLALEAIAEGIAGSQVVAEHTERRREIAAQIGRGTRPVDVWSAASR